MNSTMLAKDGFEYIQVNKVSVSERLDFWQSHFGTVKGFATFEVILLLWGSSVMSTQAAIGNTAPYPTVAYLFILTWIMKH